ncbi:MAG: insulinase family protein [bacterium]|nr:insulinase family protein [bacterium]
MVEKSVLDSGLVVISEYISTFPSFALSYTVRGGSRQESEELNGIYHLIEHMLFKGTNKYGLKDIADISDRLGGKLNAFTSKEVTQYYIKAVDEKLNESFDLLTEMVVKSLFPPEEFTKEKSVAIQEIHEAEDNPDTYAFEAFYQKVFENNALGYPVGGRVDSVSAFERDSVFGFYRSSYSPENLVLASVGNVKHEALVQLASEAFKDFPANQPRQFVLEQAAFHHFSLRKNNPSLNQVYLVMGFDGVQVGSPQRYHNMIMNDVLGSGMSSRLFQKIREEKGLAYTVSSFTDTYVDCGLHLVYAIVKPDRVEECLEAVKTEIAALKKTGITKAELELAKDSIKSSIILGLESNVSKMRFNINSELFMEGVLTPRQIIDNINKTTARDIEVLLEKYLDLDRMSTVIYGNVPGEQPH